jgi:hypothetical protein
LICIVSTHRAIYLLRAFSRLILRRFLIRGARHVIFYSLPEYARFYSELVNMLSTQTGESKGSSGTPTYIHCFAVCFLLVAPLFLPLDALWGHHRNVIIGPFSLISDEGVAISCLVLYTAYERMALERIVGAKRCAQMISGAKATFMFC